jgi:hypothetical protein
MAKKERQVEEEFSFDDILEEIASNSKELECGPYIVKELTMHHQRKNLTAGLEPVEAPLRTNKIFNEYICENVESTESMGDIADIIDVSERPYLINLLRKVTLGDEYKQEEKDGEVTYRLYEVKDDDFNIEEKTVSFECGSMTIHLEYPTITKDNKINDQLSIALGPFKRRTLKDEDYGNIADLYNLYEIMKYIAIIEKDGNEIEFDTLSISNKKKFIDKLPIRYIEQIGNFISKVKEHETKSFTAVNVSDPSDEIQIEAASLFSAKSA